MYVVLLTGGLASGKDTVSAILAQLGATVLDLDLIAKEEQEHEPLRSELIVEFGKDIIAPDGSLNRRLLAERAFADKQAADRLNAICWPPVKQRVAGYILYNSCQPMDKSELLVVQVPLLAEAPDFLDLKDEVIAVVADEELRYKRAVARGMNPQDARNRIALQATDQQRIAISDTVFYNNGSLSDLRRQVDSWYDDRIASRML